MITAWKSKKIVLPDGLFDGFVLVKDGKIAEIASLADGADRVEDCGERYLAPGFIDLHVHGALGKDFSTCSGEEAALACDFHLRHGTTTILPTLLSGSFEGTVAALSNLANCGKGTRATVAGVHLEGPYFSLQQSGAQNKEYITPPIKEQYEYILKEFDGVVKRWSYAPERDENGEFCKALSRAGVIASAGHTDAVYTDMETAFQSGCAMVTHLYSCTSTVTRRGGFRYPGVLEYAFLNDELAVEIIADGAHLPYELIRLVYKIKGREQVALVTDALAVTGLDVPCGSMNGVPFLVEDGVCKLADRSAFAGSIATTDRLVRTCVQAGLSLVDSVYMATAVPARLLGLPKGRIAVGCDADMVTFDDNIRVADVVVAGERIKL